MPIPQPSPDARAAVETAVRRLIDITNETQTGRRDFLNWLRVEFGIEKVRQSFFSGHLLTAADLHDEATYHRKKRKKPLTVTDVKRLTEAFDTSLEPLNALAREADRLERDISDRVNAAFGLTPADVQLMWDTAPPRMPFPRA